MEQVRSENYSKAELAVLRDYIVVNANELAEQMERDADGYLIYKGDMNQAAVEAMQQVGTDYGRLQGYYPQPKEIYFSELLSQTYMMGYYFPFSMEANYNGTMYIVNKPSVICHEFAHLKGFMQEDEAISCLYQLRRCVFPLQRLYGRAQLCGKRISCEHPKEPERIREASADFCTGLCG